MNFDLRDPRLLPVWKFCAMSLVAFPTMALIYVWVLAYYQVGVLAAANLLLAGIDPVLEIELAAQGDWTIFWVQDETRRQVRTIKGSSLHLVYLNLILLPALLVSTPAAWRRRAVWLGWGMVTLFIIHVGSAVGIMHADRFVQMEVSTEFWRFVSRNLKIGGQVFALLLWAALSWSYWLPQRSKAA